MGRALSPPPRRAALRRAVAAHCALVIEAVGEHCVAVKPQVACFERLGAPGWAALADVVTRRGRRGSARHRRRQARRHRRLRGRLRAGVLRRDRHRRSARSPVSAPTRMTVNPLLGARLARAVRRRARAAGAGLFVAGAHLEPGRRRPAGAGARRPAARSATRSPGWSTAVGPAGRGRCGLADVGAVVGATAPERLEQHARADAARGVPASRRRRTGRARAGSGGRVRSGPGQRRSCPPRAGSSPPTSATAEIRRGAALRARRPGCVSSPGMLSALRV